MPETIELNRERRKQLAEIMLEYPTKEDEEEDQLKQTHEEKGSTHAYSEENHSVQYEEN